MSSPYLYHDGARVSAESALGKELMKWERPADYRPENNPYPKMLYKARHRPDGKRSVHEVRDSLFAEIGPDGHRMIVAGAAEQWSRGCQITVRDDAEKQKYYEQGYRDTPQQAMDLLESRDNHVSDITAARHASDARMSEPARREAEEADLSTLKHLPEIPEKPKRKYTRKAQTSAA